MDPGKPNHKPTTFGGNPSNQNDDLGSACAEGACSLVKTNPGEVVPAG